MNREEVRKLLGGYATGTLTGGGVLNMVVTSSAQRDDIKGTYGLFTGTINVYGNGSARVGQNNGNANPAFFNMPSGWLELRDSVHIIPMDNSVPFPCPALALSMPSIVPLERSIMIPRKAR